MPETLLLSGLCLVFCCGATCVPRSNPADLYAPKVVFEEPPTLNALMDQVNHTTAINVIESNSLKVSSPEIQFRLNGAMTWERHMKFHFEARPPGGNMLPAVIAAGSDDQNFWAKFTFPNRLLVHARYDEFESQLGERKILPVSPIWIREALGIIEFDPRYAHSGPNPMADGKVVIETQIPSSRGGYLRKVVLDPRLATIHQTMLYEVKSGRMIANAHMSKHQLYGEFDGTLPHKIDVTITPSGSPPLIFGVEVGNYLINQPTVGGEERFAIPDSTGIQTFDLTQLNSGGPTVPTSTPTYTPQRSGAIPGNYSWQR
ncbi:MAG: hypothetical protein Aurels2KO_40510 [Aureliella sp.]